MPASTNLPPIITPGGNVVPTQQPYPPAAQPYVDNGLTYQSNNADFVERDDNGNIIINQGSEDNQNLVLEAMSLFYVNRSVVRNIDTRFKYFKFPAENIAVPDISFEGFGIDDLVSALPAEYRPSENFPIRSKTPDIVGLLMDVVIQGQPQTYTNTFEITRELKESGADLRFAGRLVHDYITNGTIIVPDPTGDQEFADSNVGNFTSQIFFTIIKNSYETGNVDRDFRVLSFSNGGTSLTDETKMGGQQGGDPKVKTFNIVIPNSDFETGDLFQLGATVSEYDDNVEYPTADGGTNLVRRIHRILRFGSTWLIRDAAEPFDNDELADPN
jgi:hypothetical protein